MADFDFHTAKLVALRRKGNALQLRLLLPAARVSENDSFGGNGTVCYTK